MQPEEEFNPEALHKLIDEALEGQGEPVPLEPVGGKVPFAFNDTNILRVLAEILPQYVHQADSQMILEALRSELYKGIDMGNLRNMHSVIQYCRKCPNVEPTPTVPQWNLVHPDVVFIQENVYSTPESSKFMVDAMVKAGFSSKNICLTYATRCPIKGRPVNKVEVSNCNGYLFHELQVLAPKLIVPFGNTTSAELLGAIKITEDHGRIFWVGPWAVMPALAPMYVLKSGMEEQFNHDLSNAHRFVYGSK